MATIDDFSDVVFDAIRDHVTPRWDACPIHWPNEKFDNSGDEPFIAVELHGTVYGQMSIGAEQQADNRWDEEGTLWFHLSVERNSGFSKARGALKALANLFRGTTLLNGRLEFLDASVGSGQDVREEGTKYLISVSIDWRLMEA